MTISQPVVRTLPSPANAPPSGTLVRSTHGSWPSEQGPVRALVLDDEAVPRILLRDRLQAAGCIVETCADGRRAIQRAQEEQFDIFLLDWVLPEETTGLDVCQYIRNESKCREAIVVMVTGRDDPASLAVALDGGADDYIHKPIVPSLLDVRLQVALKKVQDVRMRYVLRRQGRELKRVEAELNRSEERFALAAEGARDGVWDWDLTTNEVFYTARWKEQLGLGRGDEYAHPDLWLDRLHPADLAALRRALASHIAGRTSELRHEYRVLHEDGRYRWMLARAKTVADGNGDPWRLVGAQSDISDTKLRDGITGLPNQQQLLEVIEATPGGVADGPRALAVVSVDGLDAARALGSEAVEHATILFAERLASFAPVGQLVARIADSDFAILLRGVHDPSAAALIAHRVQRLAAKPLDIAGRGELLCNAVVGVALSAVSGNSAAVLLRDAYHALRSAAAPGGSGCQVYEPEMHDKALHRIEIVAALRRVLAEGERAGTIELLYQPVVDLRWGELVGFEALSRWYHPERGLIPPDEFIPLAEQTKLIIPLGRRVMRRACDTVDCWRRIEGAERINVAINVSAHEIVDTAFVEQLEAALSASGVEASALTIEVTETGMFDNFDVALAALDAASQRGVQVSIDDFGTGHSSLAYVHRLPANTLKIDRAFVSRLGGDPKALEIVRAVIAVAKSLNMKVVAEGIETAAQCTLLRTLGCSHGQGYFFAKPLPEAKAEALLRESAGGFRWRFDAADSAQRSFGAGSRRNGSVC